MRRGTRAAGRIACADRRLSYPDGCAICTAIHLSCSYCATRVYRASCAYCTALAHRGDGAGDAAARDAERSRLERELEEARGWLASARARLANEAFVSKAPPNVVEGARAREAELVDQVERLEDRLADVRS